MRAPGQAASAAPLPAGGPRGSPPCVGDPPRGVPPLWADAVEARLAEFRRELEADLRQRFFDLEARQEATCAAQRQLSELLAASGQAPSGPASGPCGTQQLRTPERRPAQPGSALIVDDVSEPTQAVGSASWTPDAPAEDALEPLRRQLAEHARKVAELEDWRGGLERALGGARAAARGREGSQAAHLEVSQRGETDNDDCVLSLQICDLVGELKDVLPKLTAQNKVIARHGADIDCLFGRVEAMEILAIAGAPQADRRCPDAAGAAPEFARRGGVRPDPPEARQPRGRSASPADPPAESNAKVICVTGVDAWPVDPALMRERRGCGVTVRGPDSVPAGTTPSVPALARHKQDQPGKYTVIERVVVTETVDKDSHAVAELAVGSRVHVLEVVELLAQQRVRGRLEQPAGWISLLDTENGFRSAEQAAGGRFPTRRLQPGGGAGGAEAAAGAAEGAVAPAGAARPVASGTGAPAPKAGLPQHETAPGRRGLLRCSSAPQGLHSAQAGRHGPSARAFPPLRAPGGQPAPAGWAPPGPAPGPLLPGPLVAPFSPPLVSPFSPPLGAPLGALPL